MNVNIAGAAVRHDETKAFLVVEKFDLALDHRSTWSGIACAGKAIAAAKTVGAEPIASAEPVAATAKAIACAAETVGASEASAATPSAFAEIAAGAAGRTHVCGAGIDAVDRHDLQTTRRILQIADDRRALRQVRVACRLQCGSVAECIAATFKRDEAISFGRVEPLDRALYRCLRK